jgi:hypothetical protein
MQEETLRQARVNLTASCGERLKKRREVRREVRLVSRMELMELVELVIKDGS